MLLEVWLCKAFFSLAHFATKYLGFFREVFFNPRIPGFLKLFMKRMFFLSFRNPNGRSKPWCYTKRGSAIQETPCKIEKCGK